MGLLEFLSNTKHTGILELEGPNEEPGQMAFESGVLQFAVCKHEQLQEGFEAVLHMLAWRYVYIELFETMLPASIKPNIGTSTMNIMLEAARLEDEQNREKQLPSEAKVFIRNNVGAYQNLGQPEMAIIKKVRPGVTTVADLRANAGGMPVDSALLELMSQGVVEIEGVKAKKMSMTTERQTLLALVQPKRLPPQALPRPVARVAELVYAMVDGRRDAEHIRSELRLSPGLFRACLNQLRQAGRITF